MAGAPCHYCGGKLGKRCPTGGLDRIDNAIGYVKGNVLPCCGVCNMTRGTRFTVAETRIMIDALIRYRTTDRLAHAEKQCEAMSNVRRRKRSALRVA